MKGEKFQLPVSGYCNHVHPCFSAKFEANFLQRIIGKYSHVPFGARYEKESGVSGQKAVQAHLRLLQARVKPRTKKHDIEGDEEEGI